MKAAAPGSEATPASSRLVRREPGNLARFIVRVARNSCCSAVRETLCSCKGAQDPGQVDILESERNAATA